MGTSLGAVIVSKMARRLRPWMEGARASSLRQVHLHVDVSRVIPQKRTEQARRDENRLPYTSGLDIAMEETR
jgi:hypothetical protein